MTSCAYPIYEPRSIEDGVGETIGPYNQRYAIGTNGDDGFPFLADYTYGFGGDDSFQGYGCFLGGDGNDWAELFDDFGGRLMGNNGDDYLIGSKYGNYLHGGRGDDTIFGGYYSEPKDDDALTYFQSIAGDRIYGGMGSNKLFGSNGHDYINGGFSVIFAGKGSYLNGGEGQDTLVGGWGSDTFVFDIEDFVGNQYVDFIPRGEHGIIYAAGQGFDTLTDARGEIDFTGATYREENSTESGNVISGIEAVVATATAGTVDDVLTINAYAIQAHSDSDTGDDWDSFIAHLGHGEDTFNLVGIGWIYSEGTNATVHISPEMLALAGLSEEQGSELNGYVFEQRFSGDTITVWTDAEYGFLNGEAFI
ncbi:putative iron-regulated protein frpC [Grimontia indica]|uniref:Iron-regulated protein frpC n=1 Tax=Grimontia indica TaxID=1056512 RepID=R1J1P3_9GAMM|nr:hypothetical protein [Grimontia indica]EOD81495.1 putative iron-regulated protein frpC [Grimontia indica]